MLYKAFQNYIVFKTDTLFNEKVRFKGIGGRELVIDPTFDPQRHVRTYGEVVSVPERLSDVFVAQIHRGLPSYHSYSPFTYKKLSDIPMEIEPGDRIYFHFNTIVERNFVHIEGVHPNRTWFIKCRYDQVICAVRDGKIIPTSTYVLVEPDKETWDDISVPTYSNIVGPDGKKKLKPKDQWIVTKIAPGNKFLLGFVRHVGSPYRGDECDLKPGDHVVYKRNANWENKIEDKEYFAILQRHIVARFVDGKLEPVGRNMLIKEEEVPEMSNGVHLVKKAIVQRGTVIHPGKSKYSPGDLVEFGESDRQILEFNGERCISMDHRNIWGKHLTAGWR